MKKIILLLSIFSLLSCSKEDDTSLTPSTNYINSDVKFQIIDTISFNMTTFKIDSLATDVFDNILVGKYNDFHFGEVISNGYINFFPSSYYIDDDAVLDSVVLNLSYSGYFYNDTLQQKNIKIHELNKKLDYRNNQYNFYNTTNFEVSNLIGERTFYPRISKDSIKVTLNNSFGSNLFNKIKNGEINNDNELSQFFKGLKISPGDNENASMISFKSNSSYIRFYYSTSDDPDEVEIYDFTYKDSETNRNHYSEIYSNRTGTSLPINFNNQENELNSINTNNLTYIQAGEGIVTKISLPNFKKSIENLNSNGTIYKAELKIPLNNNYYSKKLFTSDSLRVFIINQNNEIIGETRNAQIKREDPEFNSTYINMRIESFLESSLNINYYKNYGLMLIPYNYGSETTRLILNDNYNMNEKSKLKITYLTYGN